MATLRAATGDLHARLDDELLVSGPDPGPDDYLRHAAAMLGWMQPVEAELARAAWPAELLIEQRLGKSAQLEADLRCGGHDAEQIAAVPRCDALPPLDTEPRRYGALYVIEGSTLGGQVLWRRLTGRLHPWPLAALVGYGRDTGPLWRIFVSNLEQAGSAVDFAEAAAESAAMAFRTLLDWLRYMGAACPVR